jgi:translin
VLENLQEIADELVAELDAKNEVREEALLVSRQLIRYCADTIRAVHREEKERAASRLEEAHQMAQNLKDQVADYPDLYYAGYTQDALKEYVEAAATYALIYSQPLPEPEALGVEAPPYFNGLAEAASELRRRILHIIRQNQLEEGERCLEAMEEIYGVLVTVDFPSALTGGLRRTTDVLRSVLERTRGDLTMSMRQAAMQEALQRFEDRLGARLDRLELDDESAAST